MLYIISGPSSVGKSIIVARFIELNSFKRVVPFTTRERRINENETDGIEYNFRSTEELKKLSKDFTTGFWDFVFNNTYGYSSEIEYTILSNENYIILATTKIALSIKKVFPCVVIIFIDFKTKEELERRIIERFALQNSLIQDKLHNAETERENKIHYDLTFESNDPNELYESILKKIKS